MSGAESADPIGDARRVILVEGVSDRIAVETLAPRLGHDLWAEGVVVRPVGGAGGMAAHLRLLVLHHPGVRLAGLVDAGEAPVVARALQSAGLGDDLDAEGMAALGFHICDRDLEDELITAIEPAGMEALLEREGDLRSFRTLQGQPAWRGRPVIDQLRRFLGAGARRKLRYAEFITEAVELDRAPAALVAVLDGDRTGRTRRTDRSQEGSTTIGRPKATWPSISEAASFGSG